MDHQTFAQLLGNYGEFFGAVLLVGSLVYVGIQVRQNTAVSRAQIYQARAYQNGFLDEEYWTMVNSTLPSLTKRWQALNISSVRASFKQELDNSRTKPLSSAPPW